MDQQNHIRSRQDQTNDLDRALDLALAKYAAVEPRVGLEQRILATLRAEPARHRKFMWRWSVALATLVVVVATGIAWRSSKPAHPEVTQRPLITLPTSPERPVNPANREANVIPSQNKRPARRLSVRHAQPAVVTPAPKLDVFPSPRPLSEQEKILASYVAKAPDQAALLAEARMESLRQDHEEELRELETEGSGNSHRQ